MLVDGRIQWKTFTKTPPVYLHRNSCHDPQVFKGIHRGIGHRLRLTNSTNETFKDNCEIYSRALAVSGYDYTHSKAELMKYENVDPVELIKQTAKQTLPKPGCKVYWNAPFDRRLPHPRELISRNYHHIENHPIASKLFPRENLVASSKQLKNLSEMLSPTVQVNDAGTVQDGHAGDGNGDIADIGAQGAAPVRYNGSYHCDLYKRNGNCDTCSHMVERSMVQSVHFKKNFAIAGRNIHRRASEKPKLRWFVYLEEDLACEPLTVTLASPMGQDWRNILRMSVPMTQGGTK